MDYRNLGRAGLKVSEICLGTMTMGNGADQAESSRMVDTALASGLNFFDTANSYVQGTSETMLGVALKGKRHEAVIASKFFNPMGHRPNDSGTSRLHIKQQIEGILKRLQTDYIDVYQVHRLDPYTPIEETMYTLDQIVRSGKVRYIGGSTMPAYRFAQMCMLADWKGYARFIGERPSAQRIVADRQANPKPPRP